MNKTSSVLTLLGTALLLVGCAVIGTHGQEGAHGRTKLDAKAIERQAKQLLGKMVKDSDLDLREEAVWIGPKTVMVRASWKKSSEPATGIGATRHMADFIFNAEGPMALQAVEGESPWSGPRSQ